MAKLIILMGAPGCGKTYWCKQNMPENAVYISRDDIKYNLVKENEPYFSKETEVYNTFVKSINEALSDGFDVYADQTSLTRAARAKLINRLYPTPDEINVVFINRPLDIILNQNAQRTGRACVPEDAVIRMFNSIEYPSKEEGITNILEVD